MLHARKIEDVPLNLVPDFRIEREAVWSPRSHFTTPRAIIAAEDTLNLFSIEEHLPFVVVVEESGSRPIIVEKAYRKVDELSREDNPTAS